jgi:hypothetical protein
MKTEKQAETELSERTDVVLGMFEKMFPSQIIRVRFI